MNSPFRRIHQTDPSIEGFAADAGVEVADFIREVAEFRVALEADMTIAAAAAEFGAPEIASSIVDTERKHLAEFETRAMRAFTPRPPVAHIPSPPHLRRSRFAVAAALALITALGGALSYTDHPPANNPTTSNLALAAAARYAQFSALATTGDASAAQMIEAASRLHATLADLVRQDPGSAAQVAKILNSEQQQLLRWLPAGTTIVVADARALVARMRASAPANASAALSRVKFASPPKRSTATPAPSAQPAAKPAASASPKPQPKPSASPSPTPSPSPSKQPSGRPSPSPSSSPSLPSPPSTPRNPLS